MGKRKTRIKYVLKRDIVIPAGTEFIPAPLRTERAAGTSVETTIGLTKDTAGSLTYDLSSEIFDIREE